MVLGAALGSVSGVAAQARDFDELLLKAVGTNQDVSPVIVEAIKHAAMDLTPDQQKQVTAIVDDTRAQWKALYAPADAQKEQIRQQSREKIRALMTPEQKIKLEAFFHEIDDQRKKEAAAAAH